MRFAIGMPAADDLDALTGELASILDEARAAVAAGVDPDGAALTARIREAGRRTPGRAAAKAVERALQQLERVLAIRRARARLAAPPTPPAAPPRPRARAAFRAQPTITGNMEVRRTVSAGATGSDGAVRLTWDAAAAVAAWDVRFSERPDARSDYVVREEQTLPPTVTSVEVTLGELPLRVHILGRANDGRLVRRAIVSALTRDNWDDRWQRRASAS